MKPATMLSGAAAYTELTGANAMPSATAAPAAYTANICYTCHGNNGEGVDGLAPEIRHAPGVYAQWIVRNGGQRDSTSISSMSPFPASSLSDADLTAIISWLGAMPRPTTPDGLYKDFCGNCHGPTQATGGAVAVNITGLKMADVMTAVRTGYGTTPTPRAGYMPKFEVALLSDAELAQIQTFLGSIP
jgi:mono/diheme cytochrome c family protein